MIKALTLVMLTVVCAARAAPPSIEDFQRPPAFSGPVLSPDGRHVAAIINPDGKTTSVAVLATDKPGEAIPIKAFGQADIRETFWIDDDRLAFTVRPRVDGEGRGIAPGLWTMNRDGSGFKQWVNPTGWGSRGGTPQASRMLDGNWSLFQPPAPERPGQLVIRHNVGDRQRHLGHVELASLDVATGRRRGLTDSAPKGITHWVLDATGQPAFAAGSNGRGGTRIHWRDGDAGWKVWHESEQRESDRWPLAIDREGRLYLSVHEHGRRALHRADSLAPGAPTTRVVASATHDVNPGLLHDADSGQLLGAHFEAEVPQTAWFSPELAEAQADIDRRLPGAANTVSCQRCLAAPMLLVTSVSDRRPPRYFLFDRATRQLTPVAASMPWITEGRPRQTAAIAARDGLRLPLVLTHPGTPGPAPTVLLVHGGPWVRGNHWAWQAEPQFYASRGYLVLEVDFRGSTGYGQRHLLAGDKQWGLRMQDDLADALAWAVKGGLADPKRVCIVGAGYGGYAALMGLARGGISCAVASMAPTDLGKLTSRHWSDAPLEALSFHLPIAVGDAEADATLLTTNSPIRLVDKLLGPLLLAYGELDERVPLAHGKDLRDALTAAGRPPEWVSYPGERHGFYKWENRQDHWRRIEAFLAAHLAPDK
ncbi:MAG: alpha/beta hydrolase family protein [Roseateles sp.]|uniref:alpha/beta hydrolase family protein n=1 Tax=Roseateles sp. TaxID=1971397 RepID=UPI0040374061